MGLDMKALKFDPAGAASSCNNLMSRWGMLWGGYLEGSGIDGQYDAPPGVARYQMRPPNASCCS